MLLSIMSSIDHISSGLEMNNNNHRLVEEGCNWIGQCKKGNNGEMVRREDFILLF